MRILSLFLPHLSLPPSENSSLGTNKLEGVRFLRVFSFDKNKTKQKKSHSAGMQIWWEGVAHIPKASSGNLSTRASDLFPALSTEAENQKAEGKRLKSTWGVNCTKMHCKYLQNATDWGRGGRAAPAPAPEGRWTSRRPGPGPVSSGVWGGGRALPPPPLSGLRRAGAAAPTRPPGASSRPGAGR